jgi:hypothetical protein
VTGGAPTPDFVYSSLFGLLGTLVGSGVVIWAQFQRFAHERRITCRALWLEVAMNGQALADALSKEPTGGCRQLDDTVFRASVGTIAPMFCERELELLLAAYGGDFQAGRQVLRGDAAWSSQTNEVIGRLREAQRMLLGVLLRRGWRRSASRPHVPWAPGCITSR